MPGLEGTLLLIEDEEEVRRHHFDRALESLIHQPGRRGLLLGRFQRASGMDPETLVEIIRGKLELDRIPVVADASFGHTTLAHAFPIGGTGALRARSGDVALRIETH